MSLRYIQNVSETYFKDACLGHASSEKFMVNVLKFARVSKVSQILVSHFKTPFSGYLQRRIYNVANITMELFLYKYLTILSF